MAFRPLAFLFLLAVSHAALSGQASLMQSPGLAKNWIRYRGDPPVKCQIGALSHSEGRAEAGGNWKVTWVNENRASRVPSADLYSSADDPYDKVYIAVFGIVNDRLLVRGGNHKWGWIHFIASEMQYFSTEEPNLIGIGEHSPTSQLVQAPNIAGPLREQPLDSSRALIGLEEKPWRQYSNHRAYSDYDPNGSWVLVLERRGDWARVRLPKSEVKIPGLEEETYTLQINWDKNHEGWIRAYRSGPVKGSKELLLHAVGFGFYD